MKKISARRFLLLGILPGLLFFVSCSHITPPPPAVVQPPAAQTSPVPPPSVEVKPNPKMFVEDMLVSKGLRREKVHALVSDPRVDISTGIIVSNLYFTTPSGSKKNPKVMDVNPKWIGRGVTFIDEHRAAFDLAWEKYKVSPELITAILIIETNLGNYPMKYNVFRVYASLTTALDTEYLEAALKAKGDKYKLTDDVLKQAQAKGKWGLGELAALIQLSDRLGIDPIGVNGSFAGALGPAQFIPTSFVHYGVDGNGDGKIDPFDMDDCIASVANYFKLAGWKENGKLEQKRQAIWIYNHHDIYVNTIMMLYGKLIAAGEERELNGAPGELLPEEGAGMNDAPPAQETAPVKPDAAPSPEKAPDKGGGNGAAQTGDAKQ